MKIELKIWKFCFHYLQPINKDGLFVHWKQALVVSFSFITKKQSFLLDFLLYYKNN